MPLCELLTMTEFLNPLFDNPWYWLIAGAVLMGLELIAPGILLIWVGIGAVATGFAVALFPTMPLAGQIIVLIVAMICAVLLGVRLQSRRKHDAAATLNVGLEQFVGREVIAATDFHQGQGRIKLEDTTYNARAKTPVQQGDRVIVRGIQNSVFDVMVVDETVRKTADGT